MEIIFDFICNYFNTTKRCRLYVDIIVASSFCLRDFRGIIVYVTSYSGDLAVELLNLSLNKISNLTGIMVVNRSFLEIASNWKGSRITGE